MWVAFTRYFVTKGSADVMAFVVGGKFSAEVRPAKTRMWEPAGAAGDVDRILADFGDGSCKNRK